MTKEILKLRRKCPVCGEKIFLQSGVEVNNPFWRFDICKNEHKFNNRPYADYDKNCVYEGKNIG